MKLFKCKFAQAPLFLTFEQSFMFLQLKKTLHDFFSSNLVRLDLDLVPVPDRIQKNCWIRIRIRIKWMRIHRPDCKFLANTVRCTFILKTQISVQKFVFIENSISQSLIVNYLTSYSRWITYVHTGKFPLQNRF